MKKNLFLIVGLIMTALVNAQEYQTKASGNITDVSIFQQRPLTGGKLADAISAPSGHVYVIVNNDNVLTINEPCQLDSIKVMPKGTLIVNAPLILLIPVTGKTSNVTDNGGFIQLPTGPETPPITTNVEYLDEVQPKVCASYNDVVVETNEDGTLYIFDMMGKPIHTQRVNTGDNRYNFNLRRGTYIARIVTKNKNYSQRFGF